MFRVLLTQRAAKDFRRLDKRIQKRIAAKIKELSRTPREHALKLTNSKIGTYRFRIGDYRVVFDLDGENLVILRIGHRKEIYK